MSAPILAQRRLVARFIDWNLVEQRSQNFPSIGRAFSTSVLRRGDSGPPYYCHFMAWPLGTWRDEALIQRLDELLALAEDLPNWRAERSLLGSTDFADFWSLVWQLQVAEYLSTIGREVQWRGEGPDLSVEIDGERWFIECYCYRKSFGLYLFVEELLQRIDPAICVSYDLCLPFTLPTDNARSGFLDTILSPFQDPHLLEDAKARAAEAYPVVLHRHDSGLIIYLDGDNPAQYEPGIVPNRAGDPQRYLAEAVEQALAQKRGSNSLGTHHPNLVLANLALSADIQLALHRAERLGLQLPAPDLGPHIDSFAVAIAGIDEVLGRSAFRCLATTSPANAALQQLTAGPWRSGEVS